jgi:hypothetical protein
VPIETDPGDQGRDPVEIQADAPDRDERRVAVLQRIFRRMLVGERRISAAAVTRVDATMRGDLPDE